MVQVSSVLCHLFSDLKVSCPLPCLQAKSPESQQELPLFLGQESSNLKERGEEQLRTRHRELELEQQHHLPLHLQVGILQSG